MCDLREVWKEQGIEEGEAKGEALGIAKGEALGMKKAIDLLAELNCDEDTILTKICEKYGVSRDAVLEYLNSRRDNP